MTHTVAAADRASEIKFIVDPLLGERIRLWARMHLEPDSYAAGSFGDEYDTTTLYFDTPDYDVFYRRGSFGRAKYRIRRYASSETVFVERKLRRGHLLIKRRTQVLLDDLKALGRSAKDDEWAGTWFERRLLARRLRPACQISYRRIARGVMTAQGPARLTLDDSIAARESAHVGFSGSRGARILGESLILELKFRSYYMPAVFKRLIEELRLNPQTSSKYRLGMATIRGFDLSATPTATTQFLGSTFA